VRATTIRFNDAYYEAMAHRATEQGVSFAQYVREAALIRYSFENGIRVGLSDEVMARMDELVEEIRRLTSP
jgi:predicted DNA-binding protein